MRNFRNARIDRHIVAIGIAALCVSESSLATDGYFSNGYGVKSQGVGGIGIALPQDGLAAAANPAGTVLVDDQLNLGINWFRPDRSATIVGNGAGLNGTYDGNGKKDFFIPEIGFIKHFSANLAAGVSIYGNGGMNTDYRHSPFAAFGVSGATGVDLQQLFVVPSLSFKATESQALGVGVIFAYQRFKAEGLQPFAGFSSSPTNFTNRGYDSSTGFGVRLGWNGHLTSTLSAGVTWASKVKTGEFKKYSGLFAEQGGFDIPANYGVGLTWQATSSLTLAAEALRIQYSGIKSVGTSIAPLFSGAPFGASNGPGFGWQDITVLKIGASVDVNPALTLRGGFSRSDNPVPESQTLLNILAPGVVRNHLSLGASWHASQTSEFSLVYSHAFQETVNGAGSIPITFGGGNANISLSEDTLGISWTRKW
jgi:long-chain fatty acid transport protein